MRRAIDEINSAKNGEQPVLAAWQTVTFRSTTSLTATSVNNQAIEKRSVSGRGYTSPVNGLMEAVGLPIIYGSYAVGAAMAPIAVNLRS